MHGCYELHDVAMVIIYELHDVAMVITTSALTSFDLVPNKISINM